MTAVTFAVTERKMKLLKRKLLSPIPLLTFNQACFIGSLSLFLSLLLPVVVVVVVVVVVASCEPGFPPLHNNSNSNALAHIFIIR